jgi:hypothetical protein
MDDASLHAALDDRPRNQSGKCDNRPTRVCAAFGGCGVPLGELGESRTEHALVSGANAWVLGLLSADAKGDETYVLVHGGLLRREPTGACTDRSTGEQGDMDGWLHARVHAGHRDRGHRQHPLHSSEADHSAATSTIHQSVDNPPSFDGRSAELGLVGQMK